MRHSYAGSALATAMRMVVRVHCGPTSGWSPTEMAATTSFAEGSVLVLRITYLTDGRACGAWYSPDLTRRQPKKSVLLVPRQQLGTSTCPSAHLATFARLKLNVVDHRAGRNIPQRHRIP